MNILAIAAHPDDEVLGAGGFIAHRSMSGDNVYVHLLTHGRQPDYIPGGIPNYTCAAAQILGLRDVFVDSYDIFALDTHSIVKLVQSIEKYALEIQPEIVLTHHGGDIHQDHQVVNQAAMIALRPGGPLKSVKSVLTFEIASSTEWGLIAQQQPFVPNVFVDITGTLEKKVAAMVCYKNEIRQYPHPRSEEHLRNLAYVRGATIGCTAAEAFTLVRDIW